MSYILDALKKAEAERKLGSVPGLHAQTLDIGDTGAAPQAWKNPWLWISAGMFVVLAVGAAWHFYGRSPAPPAAQATVAAAPAAPAAANAPAVVPPAPAAPAAATPATVDENVASAFPPEAEKPAERPKAKKRSQETPHAEARAKPEPAPTRASDDDFLSLSDQAPIGAPTIAVGGFIYSTNPGDRSVIINLRLLREGESVSPDLKLERITQRGIILNYHGTRFRKGY